jgi:heme/copper-type cytochrome/quinol oxidase subunit 2
MRKKALAIVLITVIVLSVATWFIHNQISELQNQIGELVAQNGELQDQLSELQNQLNELQLQNREKQDRLIDFTSELAKARHLRVEITAFKWLGGFNPIGGLLLGHPVNVTVQNDDVIPLSKLKLWVALVNENTGAEIGTGGITIDRLNVRESREIYVDGMSGPWTILGANLDGAVCVVTLKVGDIVLDEWTQDIS